MWRTMQAEPSTSVPYMAHDAVKVLNVFAPKESKLKSDKFSKYKLKIFKTKATGKPFVI